MWCKKPPKYAVRTHNVQKDFLFRKFLKRKNREKGCNPLQRYCISFCKNSISNSRSSCKFERRCIMNDILKFSSIRSDTLNFQKYRKYAVDRLMRKHGVSPQKARTISLLLEILEGHRISFSKGAYRFQTKRVSTASIADDLGVTSRYVRMLLRILENAAIIIVRRRRLNRFMSLWNAFEFSGFIEWLSSYAQTRRTPVPPKEENNPRLLFTGNHFPTSDLSQSTRAHKYWRSIALEALPIGEQLPCLAQLSLRFRLNLRKHNIGHDDPSIIPRWKAFVKQAISFQVSKRMQNVL